MTRVDLRSELRALRLPVLVIHGSADRSTPLELTGRPTAALVPGCRLAVIDGAGHGLYASEPAQYNAEFIAFAHSVATSPPVDRRTPAWLNSGLAGQGPLVTVQD